MFTLPIPTPVNIPVVLPIVAIPEPALHDPPEAVSVSVMVLPMQTEAVPVIVPADGVGLTVAAVTPEAEQLLASVTVKE